MPREAKLEPTEHGVTPVTEGWFTINVRDAMWLESPHFGSFCKFEGAPGFSQLGVNVHVLQPGQPACMYHRENFQEAFLVLDGECMLIIEEEERPLRQWDFVHCPPETTHVFVGRGDRPCAILMMGNRVGKEELVYPVSEAAGRHEASVARETPDPREAYAGLRERREVPAAWPPPASPASTGALGAGSES